MSDVIPTWAFAIGFGIGLGTMVGALIILGVAHAVRLLRLPASVDTRRMAETGTGSVRSTGSAVPNGETPDV